MLNLRNNSADSVLFRLVSSFGNLDLRLFAIWPGEKKGKWAFPLPKSWLNE